MRIALSPARALASALPAALLCAACGTVAVRVPVMRPAEINMAPYQSVAIGGMTGNGDRPMTAALEESLVGTNRFQVVDRSHMDQVMRELKLSSTDLADPAAAAKLGKVVTAGALIFGDVTETYREEPGSKSSKDDKGNTFTIYEVKGTLVVRATFKVVDVATGRLLIAKTYEEKRDDTNHGYDKKPSPIDRDALERSARTAVRDHFMAAIVPHQDFVNASFMKDSDIPQLEGGIGWAERGEWAKAESTFNDAATAAEKNAKIDSKKLSKCYWNLGLSYEYAGDYGKANDMINKAFTLSNDTEMLHELDNIKRLQSDAKRLAEQTAAPEAAFAH